MKQIFLKVYPNGKTTTNASVLNFDRENKSGEIVIDYSEVDFLDWDKQLDLIFSDGTTAFVAGTGNTLSVPLLESYLKKGSMTVQPVAKRLVGAEVEKAKWQVVALSVRDSLNVLENDASITPSVAEQWDIRITEVEHDEVLRKAFETIRQNNENARIANENARLVFEAYNPIEDYTVGNKVAYNGSSYVCIADSTGNLPTDPVYWLLIASKGDIGETGATGATGEQGIPGGNITNASELPFTPTGDLSSTNVQTALAELDSEKASKTQEAWITPTLLNGWANGSGMVTRYKKDSLGVVWVEAVVTGGSATFIPVFFLPTGYKPQQQVFVQGQSAHAYANGYVSTSGDFTITVATTTSVNRFYFSFRTN